MMGYAVAVTTDRLYTIRILFVRVRVHVSVSLYTCVTYIRRTGTNTVFHAIARETNGRNLGNPWSIDGIGWERAVIV